MEIEEILFGVVWLAIAITFLSVGFKLLIEDSSLFATLVGLFLTFVGIAVVAFTLYAPLSSYKRRKNSAG